MISKLWVDVYTYDAKKLWRVLKGWKSTVDISKQPAAYAACCAYSRIALDTELPAAEVEARLYKRSADWIGIVDRKDYLKSEGYLFDSINTGPASELA